MITLFEVRKTICVIAAISQCSRALRKSESTPRFVDSATLGSHSTSGYRPPLMAGHGGLFLMMIHLPQVSEVECPEPVEGLYRV